jgi:hypothetical protein
MLDATLALQFSNIVKMARSFNLFPRMMVHTDEWATYSVRSFLG